MLNQPKHITLRPFESDEWPILSHWFYSNEYSDFFRDTVCAAKIENLQAFANMSDGYCFTLRLAHDVDAHTMGEIVGVAMVYQIKWHSKTAKLGVLIDKQHHGKGFCLEAMWSVIDYMVNHFDFRKLIVETIEDNTHLANIITKGGFIHEATFENDVLVNGEFKNVKRFCLYSDQAKLNLKKVEELWAQQQHQ